MNFVGTKLHELLTEPNGLSEKLMQLCAHKSAREILAMRNIPLIAIGRAETPVTDAIPKRDIGT